MDTLLLKPECVESLQKIIQSFINTNQPNESVICIFGDHIQFEKLDEMELLPRDVMRIVHDYYDDKMIIECSCIVDSEAVIIFSINDNNNKIIYHYSVYSTMLHIINANLFQKDDSISITYTSFDYFNLSRLYYNYGKRNNISFYTKYYTDGYINIKIINNEHKYEIMCDDGKFVSKILNHEILKRRIIVIRQLIDIIEKLLS